MLVYGFPLGFRPENTSIYKETATTVCNGTRPGWTTGIIILRNSGNDSKQLGYASKHIHTTDGVASSLYAGERRYGGGEMYVLVDKHYDLSKVTGPLMANSHPGSYCGQDAYSDMLVVDDDKDVFVSKSRRVQRISQSKDFGSHGLQICNGFSNRTRVVVN